MARVTATEVKAVMDEVTLADVVINSYIAGATALIDESLTGKGLSDAILKEIERWLSAHLVAISRERPSKEEGAGGAFIKYTGEWGKGLSSTSYGQTAIALDTSGTLASLSEGRKSISIVSLDDDA